MNPNPNTNRCIHIPIGPSGEGVTLDPRLTLVATSNITIVGIRWDEEELILVVGEVNTINRNMEAAEVEEVIRAMQHKEDQ